MSRLTEIITASDPAVRNQSLDAVCRGASLDEFAGRMCRAGCVSPAKATTSTSGSARCFSSTPFTAFTFRRIAGLNCRGLIPFHGYEHLLQRRFEEAIDEFLAMQQRERAERRHFQRARRGVSRLAFQTLADQVRRSVRSVRGNQWMFRMGHPADQPLRIRRELLQPGADGTYPDPARTHAGAHGPDAQRLERHFFSRDGFSRRRAVLNVSDRPRRARARRRAAPAGRSVSARDRRAGAAPDQRRSRRDRGHHRPRARCSTSRRIISACSRPP